MAQGNDVVSSQSLTEETTNTQRQRFFAGTLTSPPESELPTLPVDLLSEILCRLPVKLLVQLRCVCRFFNSLISDPKFAKKHLQLSTKRHHLMLTNDYDYFHDDHDELVIELVMYDSTTENKVIYDSPILSLFSTSDTVDAEPRLYLPSTLPNELYNKEVLCSCDGMFCGKLNNGSYYLWNPSIRKFKLLPPLENHELISTLSFGYDHFIDNYKVVAVSLKNEVSINTLGTNYWRKTEDIPYSDNICGHGVFVSGTVNWFASDVIISLDLEKESYQKLSLPDFENENDSWTLGVVRDCLCVFASNEIHWDVWIMTEYGNQESWTKLYTIPSLQDQHFVSATALYISEDDQLLVRCYAYEVVKLVVYDSKTSTLDILEFLNDFVYNNAIVYIESLVSP